ncbi:MAG TPA: hypothetical protein VMV63_09225 [Acidithiobacillus sp.]|nr:hypothetical protein [Acidithiobacillus sp.]
MKIKTNTRDNQFWCHCDCGMVRVELWTDDDTGPPMPETVFTMYKTACRLPLSWRDRLKQAWAAMRGELWRSGLLLDPQETVRLRDYLSELVESIESATNEAVKHCLAERGGLEPGEQASESTTMEPTPMPFQPAAAPIAELLTEQARVAMWAFRERLAP